MSYNINFTDPANPDQRNPLTVQDQDLNTQTDLVFVGKNVTNYAQFIAEDFLKLLENFAKSSAPDKPVKGQLWYDTTLALPQLRVWDGVKWTEAGNIKKASVKPTVENSIKGDLWVDSTNQQLYLFTGVAWVLVGPQFNESSTTGWKVEEIIDRATNLPKSVLSAFIEDQRVGIFSKYQFTPKNIVDGFSEIKQGITLSSIDFDLDGTVLTKFWGTSEKSDAMVVGNVTVPSANFLRGDVVSTTNHLFNIRSSSGLSLGQSLETSLTSIASGTILHQKTPGSAIVLRTTDTLGVANDVVTVKGDNKVGINKVPTEAFDVNGNILTNGILKTTNTTDSISLTTGSFITQGGAAIAKTLNVGSLANIKGVLTAGPTTTVGALGVSPTVHNLLDIGESAKRWRNVYAKEFIGDTFTGSLTGDVTGSVTGTASKLANSRNFFITGDVVAPAVLFKGDADVELQATIGDSIISAKSEVVTIDENDFFLVYKTNASSPRLRKVSRSTMFQNLGSVPTGSIFPFAGDVVPEGYLLCDGSEQRRSLYPNLFSTIGFKYRAESLLTGYLTFAVPDLRGRFPIGFESMDNNSTVSVETTATNAVRLAVFANAIVGYLVVPNNNIIKGPFQVGKVITGTGFNVSSGPAVIAEIKFNQDKDGNPLVGSTTLVVTLPPQPSLAAASGLTLVSYGTIDAGGGTPSPSRVAGASSLGNVGGSASRTLALSNLPEHEHDLKDSSGNQYSVVRTGTTATTDPNVSSNEIHYAFDTGKFLNNSGGVKTTGSLGQSFDITNPYLTINYIIYAR